MKARWSSEDLVHSNPDEHIDLRAMDSAIEMIGRYWSMDGDVMRCRACHSGHQASKADLVFEHLCDCVEAQGSFPHPWHTLARLLRNLPPIKQSAVSEAGSDS